MEIFKGTKFCCALIVLALILLCFVPAAAQAEETDKGAKQAALDYTLILPEKNAGRQEYLSDGNAGSCVRVRFGEVMEFLLPESAGYLYFTWHSVPQEAQLRFFDDNDAETGSFSIDETLYHQCYAVPKGSKRAELGSDKSDVAVSEMLVYETLPEDILLMEPSAGKADVLLVVAHTGDESYYFGGLLPILAGEKGYTVTVVFLSSAGRLAEEEAMRALYASGVKEQPLFAGFAYRLRPPGEANPAGRIWEQGTVRDYLKHVIQTQQPEVVIAHDAAGEDGDVMHAFASQLARLGIEAAATIGADNDPPEAWQVARLYEHCETGGDIQLPIDAELPAFAGRSARELAQQSYGGYTFLALYHKGAYAASTPGYTLAEEYRAPLADPMRDLGIDPMPTPVVTRAPSPVPTATAAPPEAGISGMEAMRGLGELLRGHTIAIASLGALMSALLVLWMLLRRKERKISRLLLCMIPLALGLLLAFVVPLVGAAGEIAEEDEPTPTPTLTPTPSPEPTPMPDPNDQYFRQPGEAEEVVVFDNEKDYYSYRSDTLSVEIQRYDSVNANERPLRYYVAHLRTRDANAFRPGFSSYRESGMDPSDPFAMSRRYKAVLAITGDNMTHSDAKNKAAILRAGRKYLDNPSGSTMVLSPDGMSMFICYGQTTRAQDLLDMGVMNTFSFGPELIVDGKLNENADGHYLSKHNPRVGVGLVEDGHFVIIVVEGRVSKYSYGVRLGEFAQLFMQEGCTQAYNLDGGASSCLLFMGEYVNKRMPNQYRDIPDMLMWGYSELVPGVNEPPQNSGFYSG